MRLNKHCLRIENDLDGFKQLRWMIRMLDQVTLMYNTRTCRLLSLEGCQSGGGSFVVLGCYTTDDLPRLTLQSIYDRLAEVLEECWERSLIDG